LKLLLNLFCDFHDAIKFPVQSHLLNLETITGKLQRGQPQDQWTTFSTISRSCF